MAAVDHEAKRVYASLCYVGCSGSGKLANLRFIDARANPEQSRLSVDHWPEQGRIASHTSLVLENIHGYEVDLALHAIHTVPDEHPLMVEADVIVVVVDSTRERLEDNARAVASLRALLEKRPFVVQLNKREAPEAVSVAELTQHLGLDGAPIVEASARDGQGVMETLQLAAQLALSQPARAEPR
ncbi:MAG: hypothetical protein IT384_24905 [Deltaproteobacteria bacterium]|nr:hypothetical protein [Deltaproteobacteria bacterium]